MTVSSIRLPIGQYRFSESDALLVDTNVWYYLYGPQSKPDYKVATYSGGLRRILAARSKIYVDVLVVSEFINRFARFWYHLRPASDPTLDFKAFRKSNEFVPIAAEIANATRRIMQQCERVGSGFEQLDITLLIQDFESRCCDFNDQVIAQLCSSKGLKLVTDDADFRDFDITILTANQKLLS
jgi:predicted nucleic acid-binding protein